MRKTSFDGGDIASITSGFDNDFKRPIAGILKTKRNSIKKKVQNFSLELDDAVIEPLLQKEKESTEIGNQSAKYLLSKTKTDSIIEKGDEKDKLLADKKSGMPSMTTVPSVTYNAHLVNGANSVKGSIKSNGSTVTSIHNHMNTNVFNNNNALQGIFSPKTQILVQIESTKFSGYSPSPLIFTTAKIHTDGNSKQMEPVQVTPVPILSTIEGNVIKTGTVPDYTTSVNETFRSDNEQNIQDNIFSKNQIQSAPLPHITNNISSDSVPKKSSVNKVIITSSTLIQVSQSPKIINVTPSALFKSEQSTKTSPTEIQETAKPAALNEYPKGGLEKTAKTTSSMCNLKADNLNLTSRTSGINKRDNMPKVTEMDINKNIQNPKTITSPEPGTSNQVDSSCNRTTMSDSSGTDRFTRQVSSSLSDKKIQSQEFETAERSKPDYKQTASNSNKIEKESLSKGNSDRNTAPKSNSLNLKPCVALSTAKSITPSITTTVSSVISSISCPESSQAQTVSTTPKATTITKDTPVSVVKALTTNDTTISSTAVKIVTTSANTNLSNSDKTQSASTYTTNSTPSVSKPFIVSTVKTPAVITTSQLPNTAKNTDVSVAKPLNASTPVSVALSVTTIKSQPTVGSKSTCSVSPAVSKPSILSTPKTPIITSQSTTTASQSSKSTITSVKSTAAPRMSQSSTAKIAAGSAVSTATKPSTVTTMKSSAGQKINSSTTSKPTTQKSPAAIVSTGSTTKKVSKEKNDKKASDGLSKDGKGSKA